MDKSEGLTVGIRVGDLVDGAAVLTVMPVVTAVLVVGLVTTEGAKSCCTIESQS